MRKIILSLCCALLCGHAVQAQTFIPPSLAFPEGIYPTGPMNIVSRTMHTYCNSYGNVSGSNLYVYSWSCLSPINGGFAFRRNSTTDVLISQGNQVYTNVSDLEVGLIMDGSTTYIVASYYRLNTGHFVDLWNWNVGAGTVSLAATYNLSSSPNYGRIALDVHKLYGAAVTWQVGTDIFVKVFNTSGGSLQTSNNLQIGTNASIPDVAFSHFGDLRVRVAYVDPAGTIRVINGRFNDLLSNIVSLASDYAQPGAFTGLTASMNNNTWASAWLNIDSPDDNPPGFDVWSYAYNNANGDIMGVSKFGSGAPVVMNLSGNIRGERPTLCYDNNAQSINYGWYTNFNASPQPGYVAVERGLNGAFVTPSNTYKRVANTTDYSGTPVMAFTGQNDYNNNFFLVYPMITPSGYEMRFKLVPWTATTFRYVVPGMTLPLAGSVSLSPNPFTNTVKLNGNADDSYTVHISDINGRMIYLKSGKLDVINAGLQEAAAPLKPGIYFVNVQNETTGVSQSLKTVKQ
ncbi:T9SS type A sorting domain-containing protein [Taibaiella koreensis]|uniref:T9SS type A sorting domain-containing protein n=1 Tax=Taibaiella koreensis TaxID=1268548 RepID=UPI000E59FF93|nr:T9SS type A sorting domain-containing protein [Taibaiella koreensis]